jgi:hypothetical protein
MSYKARVNGCCLPVLVTVVGTLEGGNMLPSHSSNQHRMRRSAESVIEAFELAARM